MHKKTLNKTFWFKIFRLLEYPVFITVCLYIFFVPNSYSTEPLCTMYTCLHYGKFGLNRKSHTVRGRYLITIWCHAKCNVNYIRNICHFLLRKHFGRFLERNKQKGNEYSSMCWTA